MWGLVLLGRRPPSILMLGMMVRVITRDIGGMPTLNIGWSTNLRCRRGYVRLAVGIGSIRARGLLRVPRIVSRCRTLWTVRRLLLMRGIPNTAVPGMNRATIDTPFC